MALIASALTTLADVKALLGITSATDDTRLEMLINDISVMVARLCDRTFVRTTYTSENYTGTNRQLLILREWPLVSVSSVYVNGSLIPNTLYEVKMQDQRIGAIYKSDGWNCNINYVTGLTLDTWAVGRDYTVTYIAGYYMPGDIGTPPADHYIAGDPGSLPLDLQMLCCNLVAEQYKKYRYDTFGLKQISEGGLTYVWGGANGSNIYTGLSSENQNIIDRYSRRFVQ